MLEWFSNLEPTVKGAIITGVFGIIVAIIAGRYQRKPNKQEPKIENSNDVHINISIPEPHTSAEAFNSVKKPQDSQFTSFDERKNMQHDDEPVHPEDYVHNSFIPSLDELENAETDDEFFEKLALWVAPSHPDVECKDSREE